MSTRTTTTRPSTRTAAIGYYTFVRFFSPVRKAVYTCIPRAKLQQHTRTTSAAMGGAERRPFGCLSSVGRILTAPKALRTTSTEKNKTICVRICCVDSRLNRNWTLPQAHISSATSSFCLTRSRTFFVLRTHYWLCWFLICSISRGRKSRMCWMMLLPYQVCTSFFLAEQKIDMLVLCRGATLVRCLAAQDDIRTRLRTRNVPM